MFIDLYVIIDLFWILFLYILLGLFVFYLYRKKLSLEFWLFLVKESCIFLYENLRWVKSLLICFNLLECFGMFCFKGCDIFCLFGDLFWNWLCIEFEFWVIDNFVILSMWDEDIYFLFMLIMMILI